MQELLLPGVGTCPASQHMNVSTNTERSEPCVLGTFTEPSSHGQDGVLTQALTPPLPDDRSGAESPKLLITLHLSWARLLSRGPKSRLIGTEGIPKAQDIPRASAALCTMLPPSPLIRKVQRLLELCVRDQGQRSAISGDWGPMPTFLIT